MQRRVNLGYLITVVATIMDMGFTWRVLVRLLPVFATVLLKLKISTQLATGFI
jgi:hypothetical protein